MMQDLSLRELAAVLAGLRLFQRALDALPPEIADIATDGGAVPPLSAAEVDALCARLDAADGPRPYRVVWQIDVDAASPLEAALRAFAAARRARLDDPASACVFAVRQRDGETLVDLAASHDPTCATRGARRAGQADHGCALCALAARLDATRPA